MGARSTAREAALQMLFALDTTGNEVDQTIYDFWRETPGDPEGKSYANELVHGVMAALGELDHRIAGASANWRIDRMTRVDRNVLRLGVYELTYRLDVPRAVALDEAVELAKRFGSEDSGAFVNGVLDQVADDCGRVETAEAGDQGSSNHR
jgi:transcription antitermination protein NusB